MRHHFKHSFNCILTESPENTKDNKNSFSTKLTPNLNLTLSNNLTANFSKKVLNLLLDKSKDAFQDTLQKISPKDPKKFLNLFKSNLSDSIQNENLLNYFNLLIPSISIQTNPDSLFKNLQLDFNLNHDPDSHDNQIGFNLKGKF